MNSIINKISFTFRSGEALSSSQLNSLISTEHALVDAINSLLRSFCDINQETQQQRAYTLGEAISLVEGYRL